MKERGYNVYIIPHGNSHDSEYIVEADQRLKFISNFSGSNGIGLATQDIVLMWTDIEKELYPTMKNTKYKKWELMILYMFIFQKIFLKS